MKEDTMRKLTPSQQKHLKAITEHYDRGTPLSAAQLKSELFGDRRNTGPTVRRQLNALRDLHYAGQQWSDDRSTFVLVPTDAGRAALTEHAVTEAGDTK